MISHTIVKFKPKVVHHFPRTENKAQNRSAITSQYLLDSFLADKPVVGQWVYRHTTTAGADLPLRSSWQLSYVVEVVKEFKDLPFSYSSGWPETHTMVSFYPATEQGGRGSPPWERTEDVRSFRALSEEELRTFLDDKLQDCLKAYLSSK